MLYFIFFCFTLNSNDYICNLSDTSVLNEWQNQKNVVCLKQATISCFCTKNTVFSASLGVIISSVNTRYWFWFFRKCLKWQSLYLHMVQVFTKARRHKEVCIVHITLTLWSVINIELGSPTAYITNWVTKSLQHVITRAFYPML